MIHGCLVPAKDGPEERDVTAPREPDLQRHRSNEPLRLKLADAAVEVDDANLQAHEPEHPSGHMRTQRRARSAIGESDRAERQGRREPEEQADQIVVIEVVRLVARVRVREEHARDRGTRTRAPSGGEAHGGDPEDRIDDVHPDAGQRPNEREAVVREEMRGHDERVVDGPLDRIAHDSNGEQCTKHEPKRAERCGVDRFPRARLDAMNPRRGDLPPRSARGRRRGGHQSPSVTPKPTLVPSAPATSESEAALDLAHGGMSGDDGIASVDDGGAERASDRLHGVLRLL